MQNSLKLFIVLLVLLNNSWANTQVTHIQSTQEKPQELTSEERKAINKKISNHMQRQLIPQPDGSVLSRSPVQGLDIIFSSNGHTTITAKAPKSEPMRLGLQLQSIGYDQLTGYETPQQITHQDTQLTYHWNDQVQELWTNDPTQLEQWFLLKERPTGKNTEAWLNINLQVKGNLSASQQNGAIYFKNQTGQTLVYDKLKVWDAKDQILPAELLLAENTIQIKVDDRNATYPLTIDPAVQQLNYIKHNNTAEDDFFGRAVAIDGDIMAVGAVNPTLFNPLRHSEFERGNDVSQNRGAVYVFARNNGVWQQEAFLQHNFADPTDAFGFSLALSGDTLAVGAPGESGSSSGINGDETLNDAPLTGAVFVYTRDAGQWNQQAYIKASNVDTISFLGYFGFDLDLDQDTLVVGAPYEDSDATGVNGDQFNLNEPESGAVYVFTRDNDQWSQQAYIKASNTQASDHFGAAVAVHGDTLAVGAHHEDSASSGINGNQSDNSFSSSGAIYVFTRDNVTWSQQTYIKASNPDTLDEFGYDVALENDTLVVSAHYEQSSATGVNGDQFRNDADFAGAVYVFTREIDQWSQQAYIKASNTDQTDQFGESLALAGNKLAVGAYGEDSNAVGVDGDQTNNSLGGSGAVYLYSRMGSQWQPTSYIKASNSGVSDNFGRAVDFNGSDLVIGAPFEDSDTTLINGDQTNNNATNAGAVYHFQVLNRLALDVLGLADGSAFTVEVNGGSAITVDGDGDYLFPDGFAIGEAYTVNITQQPAAQSCMLTNSTGVFGENDIRLAVDCMLDVYTVGGELFGLPNSASITLQNNGSDDLVLTQNGPFSFNLPQFNGSGYNVTVSNSPMDPIHECTVDNETGEISGQHVNDIAVNCVDVDTIFVSHF